MTSAFDDASVQGWESLEGSFGLPDPDDEHVVAAAACDFPTDRIPPTIQILRPAEFAANTVAVSPDRAVTALQRMQTRRRRPAQSLHEILDILAGRYAMTEAVNYLLAAIPDPERPTGCG
ncbi:hypothetical protein [Gordonia rhizosphera]|uniref:VapC50 C-terminal domain-containing protein n=1 Tax=Gordonia rhizosphera NBRC 16068 TaxID=1108045 RepID=K6X2J8_9ACTN|nr:hypothetical protein [Gordonia rhizosphera]GAB93024.1 hypothetical protein GORHZ_202_00130 [Gordonia rhizosphera NBRC 16068]